MGIHIEHKYVQLNKTRKSTEKNSNSKTINIARNNPR